MLARTKKMPPRTRKMPPRKKAWKKEKRLEMGKNKAMQCNSILCHPGKEDATQDKILATQDKLK